MKIALIQTSALWINFIAYFTGFAIISFSLFREGFTFLRTKHLSLHIGRAFFGLVASFLYVFSLSYIPLLHATLLFNTAPIFIPFFAFFFLSNKIRWHTWLFITFGLCGIILITHPKDELLLQQGEMFGLLAGISLAVAYTFIKLLTPYDSNSRIVFYFFFIATLLQIPFLFIIGDPPPNKEIAYAMLAGVALLLAQWFIVKAYSNAASSKIGFFQYTTIIWVGIVDWLFWGILPSFTVILGALLIITAGAFITNWMHKSSLIVD